MYKQLPITQLVAVAKGIAIEAHKNQFRNDGKTPYITHPEEVSREVEFSSNNAPNFIASAWLHDVVEDTPVTLNDLISKGFPFEVVEAVALLTRTKDDDYADYIFQISKNIISRVVKIADIKHNLSTLDRLKEPHKHAKYKLALRVLQDAHTNRI